MPAKKKARYYRAKESFVVTVDGLPADSVNAGEVFHPDHPYVKRYMALLEPTDRFGRFDIEQATAGPGEKRE